MLKRRWWQGGSIAVGVIAMIGCNSPPQGEAAVVTATPGPTTFDVPFIYMKDSAMQHQASISDLHFVPHTTELNGLGVAYLDRLTKLHAPYGGTVRYATTSTDEDFVATRLAHLSDYLEAAGADMSRINVVAAMPGGRGMRADEALSILAENPTDEELAKRMQVNQ